MYSEEGTCFSLCLIPGPLDLMQLGAKETKKTEGKKF